MSEPIRADGFPADEVRARARAGASCAFPPCQDYGVAAFGARPAPRPHDPDGLDRLRLVPPVFMPGRLDKLVELGREPVYTDVVTETEISGFRVPVPLFVSALGSTQLASSRLGDCIAEQAGTLGIPLVLGENVVPVHGYGGLGRDAGGTMLARLGRYASCLRDGFGGVVIQQSTQDADAEVWNLVYSDPQSYQLLSSGRLAFELKVGQGAKPGLGGMAIASPADAPRLADWFTIDQLFEGGGFLRSASPGTFTSEILRQQVRFMRNSFPRAKAWVKLPPGRDVREAALVAWEAGADAVTVDGAEAGSGWAPSAFLGHVGLPLGTCLQLIGRRPQCLLACGRMWEGTRVVKSLALGARAAGLGRAALLAADEDRKAGLIRLVECLTLEIKLLVSALGKYACAELDPVDLWHPIEL
ncbi:MAG: glutamate synthase-related protein [Streptosporangiaceae bacterium]